MSAIKYQHVFLWILNTKHETKWNRREETMFPWLSDDTATFKPQLTTPAESMAELNIQII